MPKYRFLGRSGLRIAPISLGTANFGAGTSEQEAFSIMAAGVEAGINFIDTADSYSNGESERIIGRAFKKLKIRNKVVLASKVHFPTGSGPNNQGNSRLHVQQAVEESLRRLQTDVIDLYFLHRPDFQTAQEETLRVMDDLISQGKIRYFGTSTYPAWYIMEGLAISERLSLAKSIAEQAPYNLADRRIENEVLPLCIRYNVGMIVWSPLAGGIFSGSYQLGEDLDERLMKVGRKFNYFKERITSPARKMGVYVGQLAREFHLTPAQLAIIWVKEQPGVTSALLGPRLLEHLTHILEVMDHDLSQDIVEELDKISYPGSAVADFYNTSGWMKQYVPKD